MNLYNSLATSTSFLASSASSGFYIGKVTYNDITYEQFRGDDGANVLIGKSKVPNFLGGRGGDDDIRGGSEADNIFGGDGNDIIRGNGGGDKIYGGAGDDAIFNKLKAGDIATIYEGVGNGQVFIEGNGETTLGTGAGDDYINGSGRMKIFTNIGNDSVFTNMAEYVEAFLGADDDNFVTTANLNGGSVYGGAGFNTYNVTYGGTFSIEDFKPDGDALVFGEGMENRVTNFDSKLPDGVTFELTGDGIVFHKGEAHVTVKGLDQSDYDILMSAQGTDTDTTTDTEVVSSAGGTYDALASLYETDHFSGLGF